MDHPFYSLDLAPGDLKSLKKGLVVERFAAGIDLKQDVSWIDRNADICNAGIQASLPRWE
jgi:hypothetical protein